MRYFLDTEFNGYQGELISLALVNVDFKSLYMVFDRPANVAPWVQENVIPYIESVPADVKINRIIMKHEAHRLMEEFFKDDDDIEIVVDWPDDIQYLSRLMLTGPGTMINIPRVRFIMERIDAWPLSDPDKMVLIFGHKAIQHNSFWDAVALRDKFFEVYPQTYQPYAKSTVPCVICGEVEPHTHTRGDYNEYRTRSAEKLIGSRDLMPPG